MLAIFGWCSLVLFIGAAVGACELLARYRDAPFDVIQAPMARTYIVANAAATVSAYLLVIAFDPDLGQTDQDKKHLLQVLLASFGAMAFFRSSLFTVRIGDTDVAVGPGVLFQILLFATDRYCDRNRAGPRSQIVNSVMRGVDFELAKDALPNFCFELMQNVSAGERQQFRQVVDALAGSSMSDSVKVLNLGLMLMNVVGEKVLRAAVDALGQKIQGPASLKYEVLQVLASVDFGKGAKVLIDVSYAMSNFFSTPHDLERSRADVQRAMETIAERADLDNQAKMVYLGLELQRRVGDAVLRAAVAQLGDGIRLSAAAAPPVSAP